MYCKHTFIVIIAKLIFSDKEHVVFSSNELLYVTQECYIDTNQKR